jgi:hypothetical protein
MNKTRKVENSTHFDEEWKSGDKFLVLYISRSEAFD